MVKLSDTKSHKSADYYSSDQFGRKSDRSGYDNAPIGIFDSGLGGLTVTKEISEVLPDESIIYVGDTARFPYGPRPLEEVDGFAQQIGGWLVERGVKLIVIACNSATAAGLPHAQEVFDIPIIGVVDPGARAAALATKNRRVGVIATKATIESEAYTKAIHNIDAGIKVFTAITPKFVEIAERGLCDEGKPRSSDSYSLADFQVIAHEYLTPLKDKDIDTLVLGCTHFPLIQDLIADILGPDIALISSAEEVARDVMEALSRKGNKAQEGANPSYEFYTTSNDIEEFKGFGSRVFEAELEKVSQVIFS